MVWIVFSDLQRDVSGVRHQLLSFLVFRGAYSVFPFQVDATWICVLNISRHFRCRLPLNRMCFVGLYAFFPFMVYLSRCNLNLPMACRIIYCYWQNWQPFQTCDLEVFNSIRLDLLGHTRIFDLCSIVTGTFDLHWHRLESTSTWSGCCLMGF
jgi:hypothetical protein